MWIYNYRRRGHETAAPIERKIGVFRRWEDFCAEVEKLTGWLPGCLKGIDLDGLKEQLVAWNDSHVTEEQDEKIVWQRLLVEEVGAKYQWALEPSDHTALFIGENRYDLLRQVKEFIKKEENLQELYEIRKDDNSGETLFRAAISLLSRDYSADVDSQADDLIEAMLNDEVNDDEDLDRRLSESLDSSARVTYTVQAQACLLVSNNDGTGIEEGLIDTDEFKGGVPWSKLAYCTFEVDVKEELNRREKTEFSDKETEDPLERFCDWEIEELPPGDADEEASSIEICTIEYKGKTYTGRGTDREDALADLRKNYSAA